MAARWILALSWLAAVLPAADAMPLPVSGPVHAAVVHALTRLAQRDPAALAALPDSAFLDPPALNDPERPGTAWRWTLLIPWQRAAGADGLGAVHARLAERAAHLSPGLERDLGTMAADGSCTVAGGLRAPPARPAETHPDPLPGVPGWPEAAPHAAESDPASALRRNGLDLVRTDDSGLIAWQLVLEANAQVWLSSDAAIIAESRGWRWLDHGGISHVLPPMPADVSTLGIDAGAAFFALGSRGWRLSLGGTASTAFSAERPESLDLGGEALGAPLAGDGACLWLTMHTLVWWTGSASTTVRHGLPAGRGWRLARGGPALALILAPDGRAWAVTARKAGDPATDERLGLPQTASDLPRAIRFRAALAGSDWATARTLADGAAEQAALALYAGDAPPPDAGELLPHDPAELSLPAIAWRGSLAAWARPVPMPGLPASYDRERPLTDAAEACPIAEEPRRTQEGLVVGQRSWLASDDGERAEAICREDGRLRWNARWLPEPGLAAPARALALTDGHLLVGEGDSRLLAFAADTGTPVLDVRPRRVPVQPGRTWLRRRPGTSAGAVVLFPPGIDDHLGWIDADGGERVESLPARARWLLCLPDGMRWLALADGSARMLIDSGKSGEWLPVSLPAELVASPDQPRLIEGGIAAGARLWRWRPGRVEHQLDQGGAHNR